MFTSALPAVGPCGVASPSGPCAGTSPQTTGAAGADEPGSFAHLLGQADARHSAEQSATDDAAAQAAQARPAPAQPAPARTAQAAAPQRPSTTAAGSERKPAPVDVPTTDETDTTTTQGADTATAPDAAALLAALAALPRATPPATRTDELSRAPADDAGRRDKASGAAALSAPATASGGDIGAATSANATAAAATVPPFAARMDSARAAHLAGEGRLEVAAASDSGGELRAAAADAAPLSALPLSAPAPPAATHAPAPAEARLPASPGSPDFAAQLAGQLTTFVRDGVQHARLELHPLELGPVTVQIRLDGANAQVHLAAENAQTRQALEQAMPALAGSLRESGLTLSGGGVSDQPRQPADPGAGAGSPRAFGRSDGGDDGSAAALLPVAAAAHRRGVVDLVA